MSFVGMMMAGFAAAAAGLALAFVEPMIMVSVLALGLAVVFPLRLSVFAAAGILGVFALFHGHTHGGELGSASVLAFGPGFAVSTALLHAVGIGLALAVGRAIKESRSRQALGWVTAFGGLWAIVGS